VDGNTDGARVKDCEFWHGSDDREQSKHQKVLRGLTYKQHILSYILTLSDYWFILLTSQNSRSKDIKMPDGDIIHNKLPRRFLDIYGQLCEGHWEPAELGYKMLQPLKGQLKFYGNAPIKMSKRMAALLQEFINRGSVPNHSSSKLHRQIDSLSRVPMINCKPRAHSLLVQAANSVLFRIEQGYQIDDAEFEIMKGYVDNVYKSDFEELIHCTDEHYGGASFEEVQENIQNIRPYVERGRDAFSEQLVRSGDVNRLRRPRRLTYKEASPTVDDYAW
jgi:hypothetical protein